MGDVAMTIPVLYPAAESCPDCQFVMVSRPSFEGMFDPHPENVSYLGIDLDRYKGIGGIFRLFRRLHAEKPDAVADLHDVLRTKALRFLFRLSGIPCCKIHKGRREKKSLTRSRHKRLAPLATSFERYRDVFRRLGFDFPLDFRSLYNRQIIPEPEFLSMADPDYREHFLIGIAPFAKHPGKIYPVEKMEKVVETLSRRENTRIFLFGGGHKEASVLQAWEEKYPHTFCCAHKLPLQQEIALLGHLDLAVSMDSANMHIASLAATPVLSVWGATHPFAGFMGWNQKLTLQTDLPCRPCSVFGNKPCKRGDYACLNDIPPETVIHRIDEILKTRPDKPLDENPL